MRPPAGHRHPSTSNGVTGRTRGPRAELPGRCTPGPAGPGQVTRGRRAARDPGGGPASPPRTEVCASRASVTKGPGLWPTRPRTTQGPPNPPWTITCRMRGWRKPTPGAPDLQEPDTVTHPESRRWDLTPSRPRLGGGLGDWTVADMQAATKVAPDTGPCSLPGSPLRAASWPHPRLGLGPEGDAAHAALVCRPAPHPGCIYWKTLKLNCYKQYFCSF